jgi:hypothetical protein
MPIAKKIPIAHEAVAKKIIPVGRFLFGKHFPFPSLLSSKCIPMKLDSHSLIFFPAMGIE